MYTVENLVNDEPNRRFSDSAFINFVKQIKRENKDNNMKVTNAEQAEEYMHEYCNNFRFIWSQH